MFLDEGFISSLLQENKLRLPSYKILLFLLSTADEKNITKSYTYKTIEEKTGIKAQQITVLIRDLIDNGLIEKNDRDYIINRELFKQ